MSPESAGARAGETPFDAILVAAGRGERLGQDVPKARALLLGVPLFLYSVRTLCRVPGVERILLVVPPEEDERRLMAKVLDSDLEPPDRERVTVISGGERRQDSVREGLEWLRRSEIAEDRVILIHDAARPLVTPTLIARCLEAIARPLNRGGQTELPGLASMGVWGQTPAGVIPALPVRETLKLVYEGRVVLTQPRENLFTVQTPQCFRFGPLLRAHHRAVDYNVEVSDDAALLEWQGIPVYTVAGEGSNLKVTFPEDLRLAGLILHGLRYDPPEGLMRVEL